MKLENIIYCGDNLTWLKKFPDNCIDLIYIDPPFFSNKHYEVIFNDGEEIRSFEDRWKGGIAHYIQWMRDRVFEMHRILKDTGSFYLHCDWHASHYLKVMCDDIFGYNNFKNEIIWCYTAPTNTRKNFPKKHDIILRYVKTDNWIFNYNDISVPYSEETIARTFRGAGDTGLYLDKDPETKHRGRLKPEGKIPEDWWILPRLQGNSIERLGYPTQKPEALILQRKWIGIDVSPSACKLMKNRVEKVGARGTEIIGLPVNIRDLKALPPFEFQNWCVGALGGTVNPKKVGDMGIDGFTFMNRYPIQVKQSEHIGRNVIDNFETALQRAKQDMGYIIAFSFGKGAYEEVARVKHNGLHIELLTVDKILEYEEEAKQGKLL